jgi:aryl-alcohol dehydrogenase-like predicted oxidoreductase
MELRRLGRSGLRVSPLGLGTARMAGLGWRHGAAPAVSPEARRFGPLPADAMRAIDEALGRG